jgi:hypothetical protein
VGGKWMKTAGMITVHRTLNYGTMLQMYACAHLFEQYGYNVVYIDYHRENDITDSEMKAICQFVKSRVERESDLKRKVIVFGKSILQYSDSKKFYDVCKSFTYQNFKLTSPSFSLEDIKNDLPLFDLFCSGSDQIWNSDYNGGVDEAYMLSFVPNGIKKIAFASSIGKDRLNANEKLLFKKYLASYSAISVRERSAKELLSSIGIDAYSVIDPTLMLNTLAWDKIAAPKQINKKYLLIYKLKGDTILDEIAKKIAEKKGLEIVRVSFSRYRRNKNETSIVLPSVNEFLSLVKYADYVVTNSFHGTCFSINYHVPFTVVAREKYNTRVSNILETVGLEDRMMIGFNDNKLIIDDIDFDSVEKKLEFARVQGKEWLNSVVNS